MMPMMRTRPLRELTSTWVRGAGGIGGCPHTAPAGQRPTSQLTSAVESAREARESSAAAAEKC